VQFRARRVSGFLPRTHHEIHARQLVLMQSERLADDPADAVALDSAAGDADRHGQAETGPTFIVPACSHTKKSITEPPAPRVR
jgi:hypothetical protein